LALQRQLTLPFTLLLGIAYVVPGLVGHDPWKPNEATASESSTTFGVAAIGSFRFSRESRSWKSPVVLHQRRLRRNAVFFLAAAARWSAPDLGHYAAATLVLVGLSARATWGEGRGLVAVIAFLGCIGLLVDSHLMYTDIALLAGFALSYYGLALSRTRPALAGLALAQASESDSCPRD